MLMMCVRASVRPSVRASKVCTLFFRRPPPEFVYMEGEARPVRMEGEARPAVEGEARSNYCTPCFSVYICYRTVVLSTVLHPHVNVRACVRPCVRPGRPRSRTQDARVYTFRRSRKKYRRSFRARFLHFAFPNRRLLLPFALPENWKQIDWLDSSRLRHSLNFAVAAFCYAVLMSSSVFFSPASLNY